MRLATRLSSSTENERDLLCRAMFDGIAAAIAICQLDGQILENNPAWRKMVGNSLEPRHPASGINARTSPAIDRLPVLPDPTSLAELLHNQRSSIDSDQLFRRSDGSEFWGHQTISVGRDRLHRPAFLIAILADVTDRKQIEERLHHTERLEAIGRFAGGIAHDFNNLLTGILLYCDLLEARSEAAGLHSAEFSATIDEIRLAGQQGAAFTQQLLASTRDRTTELRAVQLNDVVTSSENLLRRLIGEQIQLFVTLDPGSTLVLADATQFQQVLLNLVLNARDAMPKGGTIHVSTANKNPSEDDSNGQTPPVVTLAVKDNGTGMTADTRSRIFEPFFTTKKAGEGTGIGLATVQRIVIEAGGSIAVHSEPGHGSCFEISLPSIQTQNLHGAPRLCAQPDPSNFVEPIKENLHGP